MSGNTAARQAWRSPSRRAGVAWTLQITDDGDGFEVARTLQDAAQRGRLGLVGGSERVRLLGGTFDVRSRVGGPTTVSVTVPRWQPLAAEGESLLQLAY